MNKELLPYEKKFVGNICKDDNKIICYYDNTIYYDYLLKHKNEIFKIFIGNNELDVPYFCAYDKIENINIGLRTMSLKPKNYDINTPLYMLVTNDKDEKIETITIPLRLSYSIRSICNGEITEELFRFIFKHIPWDLSL